MRNLFLPWSGFPRFFEEPDDILAPPAGPPAPKPPAEKKRSCEFCECPQAPDGSYLSLSAKARGYRDQAETLARVQLELDAMTRDRDALKTKLADLETAGKPKRSW